jgi:hypothetical protein
LSFRPSASLLAAVILACICSPVKSDDMVPGEVLSGPRHDGSSQQLQLGRAEPFKATRTKKSLCLRCWNGVGDDRGAGAQTSQVSGIRWIIAGVPQSSNGEFRVAGRCRGGERQGEDEFALTDRRGERETAGSGKDNGSAEGGRTLRVGGEVGAQN